jgi:outer membrane protein assembly factor BamE (lipoprotein component of BamABCDE complex)
MQQQWLRVLRVAAALGGSAAVILGIAGCDPQRVEKLEEGVSTEVEVRKQFGDPVTIETKPDGSRVFDYPRQPEGWTNYRIEIGPDGKMSSLRQLLNADNFARVQPGMSTQEVLRLLGRPAMMSSYELKKEELWSWRFKENNQDGKMFNVTFGQDGRVRGSAVGEDVRDSAQSGR